jgi:hypothetical protein
VGQNPSALLGQNSIAEPTRRQAHLAVIEGKAERHAVFVTQTDISWTVAAPSTRQTTSTSKARPFVRRPPQQYTKWCPGLTVSFGSTSAARRMANAWGGFRPFPDTHADGEVWPIPAIRAGRIDRLKSGRLSDAGPNRVDRSRRAGIRSPSRKRAFIATRVSQVRRLAAVATREAWHCHARATAASDYAIDADFAPRW